MFGRKYNNLTQRQGAAGKGGEGRGRAKALRSGTAHRIA
nr:MAG TPA: hypothetical protein [Bacteriophage sp.]